MNTRFLSRTLIAAGLLTMAALPALAARTSNWRLAGDTESACCPPVEVCIVSCTKDGDECCVIAKVCCEDESGECVVCEVCCKVDCDAECEDACDVAIMKVEECVSKCIAGGGAACATGPACATVSGPACATASGPACASATATVCAPASACESAPSLIELAFAHTAFGRLFSRLDARR